MKYIVLRIALPAECRFQLLKTFFTTMSMGNSLNFSIDLVLTI